MKIYLKTKNKKGGIKMPKQAYVEKKFKEENMNKIHLINEVIRDYDAQGLELTLRQVYYQMVARGFIENTERSYKNLGALISDARLAGLIDWYAIVDRTRGMRKNSHWNEPEDVIASARASYSLDKRKDQHVYVEVWVEKDALVGIVGQICRQLDVPYFSCRGYTSQTEMWNAAQRFIRQDHRLKRVIIHLGDHDPSGIDMSRDIQERLDLFGAAVEVKRVALTIQQIRKYSPPPNPTKVTDSRAGSYIKKYGHECWELDALEPNVMIDLIKKEMSKYTFKPFIEEIEKKEAEDKKILQKIENYYSEVESFIQEL